MYDTNPDNCNGKWHGLNASYEVGGSSGSLNKVGSMAHGRWYPTLVTLSDGRVFVGGGIDEYGVDNDLIEIYDPSSKSWSIRYDPSDSNTYCVGAGELACVGAGSPCYGGPGNGVGPGLALYPRMHLMPSGLLILCGGSNVFRTWDPSTGIWSTLLHRAGLEGVTVHHFCSLCITMLRNGARYWSVEEQSTQVTRDSQVLIY